MQKPKPCIVRMSVNMWKTWLGVYKPFLQVTRSPSSNDTHVGIVPRTIGPSPSSSQFYFQIDTVLRRRLFVWATWTRQFKKVWWNVPKVAKITSRKTKRPTKSSPAWRYISFFLKTVTALSWTYDISIVNTLFSSENVNDYRQRGEKIIMVTL